MPSSVYNVVNALSFDVEEYFQVANFEAVFPRDDWDRQPSRVVQGTGTILELLAEFDVRATFFILGWVAQRHPELVRQIAAAGHEVASHGYGHELVYRLTAEQFAEDVRQSLGAIRAALPTADVTGYRAPSFSVTGQSLWALDVLGRLGFRYDSSIFPVAGHDRYGVPSAPRFAHRLPNQLWELPPSTVRLCGRNLPVAGGGYFRLLPLWLTRRAIRRINREGQPAVIYLHPWEFDPDQPRVSGVGWKMRFRHSVNIRRTGGRLRSLLGQFRFAPIREVLGV